MFQRLMEVHQLMVIQNPDLAMDLQNRGLLPSTPVVPLSWLFVPLLTAHNQNSDKIAMGHM